jgi:SAM-dependent methyltransferase
MKAQALLRCARWLLLPGRTGPIYDDWGFGAGTPIDRWYIERFLSAHAGDIRGDVLEVRDDRYTQRFGSSVRSSTILDIDPGNPQATLVANLEEPNALPPSAYDCIVLTQTLHYIFHLQTAAENIHRALRPGGICLATAPTISRLDYAARETGEHWRLTHHSAARLFGEQFRTENTEVAAPGNARAAVAFLLGLPANDLRPAELSGDSPYFPLLVTVRAQKALDLRAPRGSANSEAEHREATGEAQMPAREQPK